MKYNKTVTTISISIWILILVIGVSVLLKNDIGLESGIFGAKSFIEENMLVGISIFMIIYIIRPLFFIPATPFDLFSGMVFGPGLGFLISSISSLFTTMFGYVVGVLTGGIFIYQNKTDKKRFQKLKIQLKEHTFFTALMMHLMLLPYDLTNYICGVLRIPFFKFISGTFLGVLPACFIFVSAGAAFHGKEINSYTTLVENINYLILIISSVFFMLTTLIARTLKKKYTDISL